MDRRALVRRPGVVRRGPHAGVVGHSEQPHAALRRNERHRVRVPPAGEQHQRPHRRPPRPARQLRAPDPPRDAHRARRQRSPCWPTHWQGKRLNSPNDVVVQFGRQRSGSPTRATASTADYEGDEGRERDRRLPRLPRRPASGEVAAHDRRLREAQRAGVLARRIAAVHRRHRRARTRRTGRGTCAASRWGRTAARSAGGEVFAECTNGLFDGFRLDTEGRIWTSAGDGVHCLRRRRHAAGQDHWCPSAWPTCASAGPSATGCSSAPPHRSMPSR